MPNQTEPKLHNAIENAAKTLPDGFRIEIVIEKNSGSVSLLDPDGNDHDFPSNRENLTDEINDAVAHALVLVEQFGAPIGTPIRVILKRGDVIRTAMGHKKVIFKDRLMEVGEVYIGSDAHADGDFSYVCTSDWCRCQQ